MNTGLFDLNVICTSDIDKEVMVSYAAIHCGLTWEMIDNYSTYPSKQQMVDELSSRKIGYDFKQDKPYNWNRLKDRELKKYWLAMKLSNNLGDISNIESLPYADVWTVSFCCQDISAAGHQAGFTEGSGTRSSLVWEQIRLLRDAITKNKSPKYLLFENVKNLVSKKFKPEFDRLIQTLDELGYNTYYQIINAKNCGIPQNRERVFGMCIRKDIDTRKFVFPTPFDSGKRLKDMLEQNVDEKYYINSDKVDILIDNLIKHGVLEGGQQSINPEKDGTCRTIKAQYQRTSLANFTYTGSYGATGVIDEKQ